MKALFSCIGNQLAQRGIRNGVAPSSTAVFLKFSASSSVPQRISLFKNYSTIVESPPSGQRIALNTIRDNEGARKKVRPATTR